MNNYNNNYNNNDLIIKELSEKLIIQKKHITIIEQDIIRMNENVNFHLEKYKNTINEKIKLNNLIIDNFTKDIIYRISIIESNNDNRNNDNKNNDNINNDNRNNDKIIQYIKTYDNKINTYDKKLLTYKNDYEDKIYNIEYQLIKLKQDINDNIDNLSLNIENKIIKYNNTSYLINICGGLLSQLFIYLVFY